ncbi:MAG: hypothetical protein RJA81_1552, partial [Planctomycetota bacterium]
MTFDLEAKALLEKWSLVSSKVNQG